MTSRKTSYATEPIATSTHDVPGRRFEHWATDLTANRTAQTAYLKDKDVPRRRI